MEKMKLILDTDIGDDIDDALALALALEMPEVELLGVTTVFIDTDKRARIAKKLLTLWGSEAPVYAGMNSGMSSDHSPCQYTPDLAAAEYAPVNDPRADHGAGAVDFLVESARRYGARLTLVAIGPLTNVAAAIRKDPESMRGIRIVLMGGCFYRQFNEWNIYCDSAAAGTVLDGNQNVTCIGLEVTYQTGLNDAQQRRIMSAELDGKRRYLSLLVRLHNRATKRNAVLHDPLTLYYAVHPEILTTENILVRVETKGEYTAGMTVNMDEMYRYLPEPLPGKRLTVGKTVQAERFIREFLDIVFPEPAGQTEQ